MASRIGIEGRRGARKDDERRPESFAIEAADHLVDGRRSAVASIKRTRQPSRRSSAAIKASV